MKKIKHWKEFAEKLSGLSAFFVTATGTGTGKTFVSGKIAEYLKAQGKNPGYIKPFAAGDRNDLKALRKILSMKEPDAYLNPYFFRYPLAPYPSILAEKRKNFRIDFGLISDRIKEMAVKYKPVIVEGIGGVYVPLDEKRYLIDLIAYLKLPVVLISAAGLGSLNHTILTVKALAGKKIEIAGIVLNNYTGKTPAEKTNPEILSKLTALPVHILL